MSLYRQTLTILGQNVLRGCAVLKYNNRVRHVSRWVAPTLKELYRRQVRAGPQAHQPRSGYLEWNYDAEIYAFSKRLSEEFQDQLLRQAFTQRSYVIKQELAGEHVYVPDNTELIKTGTQFLTNYISHKYNSKYLPDIVKAIEDHLTSQEMLAHVSFYLGVKELILSDTYPPDAAMLANTFTALVGALKASSGDERTGKFVDDFLICQLNGKDLFDVWNLKNPYEYLTRILDGKRVEARLCNKSAISTILANYQVGLYDDDKELLGIGWGESVEVAKDSAALDAIIRLQNVKRLY